MRTDIDWFINNFERTQMIKRTIRVMANDYRKLGVNKDEIDKLLRNYLNSTCRTTIEYDEAEQIFKNLCGERK